MPATLEPRSTMSVYDQLEAAVLPIMTHYREDLTTHDREQIAHIGPDCPFLHWATPLHTVLSPMPPADDADWPAKGVFVPYLFGQADRYHLLDAVVTLAEYHLNPCNTPASLVHYYNGHRLYRITAVKALEIARDYHAGIELAWKA